MLCLAPQTTLFGQQRAAATAGLASDAGVGSGLAVKGVCEEDFGSLDELLSMDREGGALAAAYESDVAAALDRHEAVAAAGGRRVRLAVLMMEPLVRILCQLPPPEPLSAGRRVALVMEQPVGPHAVTD